jgi:hypothetical protein
MFVPPQFPYQKQLADFLAQIRAEQKKEAEKLRQDFEDFREERKIGLQKLSLGISILALVATGLIGLWNARIAYKSLSTARRGFVAVRVEEVSEDGSQVVFEIRGVPPNPVLHIRLDAACGTYVENGRKPEDVLVNLTNYETNLMLSPGESRIYSCHLGSSDGMHAPHGIVQKSLLGVVGYRDLSQNEYKTRFCFEKSSPFQMPPINTLTACATHNDAE